MAASFDYLRRLGSGHFGEVWLVIDTGLNAQRALKLIPPDKVTNQNNFFHEAQLLKMVEHPSIVKVEEAGTMEDGTLYVAMEYLPKGSLEDEAKGAYVPLSRAIRLMIDVLRGLEYAHSKNIIHRDIKPANILIGESMQGKLSDFGLAITRGAITKSMGVKDYAYIIHLAPEINNISDYSVASDIFACGVTLYRLVNGDSYLQRLSLDKIHEGIANGSFPDRRKYREFIPKQIRRIINKAISIEQNKRYKSAELLRHALEQVPICANWNEQVLSDRIRWSFGRDKYCVEVERIKSDSGTYSVQTRRGSSKYTLRRITKLCLNNVNYSEAVKFSSKILQDFVTGVY